VLVACPPKISDSLTAQKREVSLYSGPHRANGEVAIVLPLLLAVENVVTQRRNVQFGGDRRQ
jgi:hypothetical protein